MKLQIKNMVSMRCKLMLQNLVNKFGLHIKIIKLGELDITEELDKTEKAKFRTALREIGLDIIDDKRLGLIEHIKNVVVEMVHHADEMPKVNFSNHLSETLGYDYTYMANVFSETEGITIEQFVILHKVERIKELITNGELNITEIAFKMNYSSVGHLSSQFKKSTGFTPSEYKLHEPKVRINIENLGNRIKFPFKHQVLKQESVNYIKENKVYPTFLRTIK